MRRGLQIGKILGIPILLDPSWLFIFSLLTYLLSEEFGVKFPQWSTSQHWVVGLLTSLFFFGSVLFHELFHSIVARYYKIRVVSITLFIFGGVSRIGRDPAKPVQEFNIAVAGPVANFLLAAVFFGVGQLSPADEKLGAFTTYLAAANFSSQSPTWLRVSPSMAAVCSMPSSGPPRKISTKPHAPLEPPVKSSPTH